MSFVHLHVHSEYSLLDGFSNIKKLVKRAVEMGMPAVGLTDHGTMFGVIDFYNAATEAGIKPIIGIESYLAPRGMHERDSQLDKKATHILLLAENETGYHNLLQIASAAQMDGFYYYPRIDHDFLAQHSEGIICTSGCMSAEVPRLIQQENLDGAQRQLDWYFETFGKKNFFLELQSHDIPELANINKMLVDLGRRYEAQFVATNDVHYIDPADARLQDILLAIQTGCLLSDPNRMRMTSPSFYLRSPQEMAMLFSDIPEAISNTLLIAERTSLDLGFKGYHLPNFEVPEGCDVESYLRNLCEIGLERRYGARKDDPVIRQRLDYELTVIHKMGFDTYFLIVWDLCHHAREEGIWYNARGSAAGSIVAYSLDITLVDPIDHGLIFERFLNPGRVSMPDIDLDFRDDRRAEMLEYTARKYGDDKVAQIITFGTLGARAAIRDVGRVMDIPLAEVDRVAKLIPNIPGKPTTVSEALEEIPELKKIYDSQEYLRDLIDTASEMEGVVRNAGTHAAGVIITDKPVIEYIPLHRPTGSSGDDSPIKTVTQFEMSVLDSLGLLKVDFLGLATLSIMARACELIRQRHGIDFNLDNIPTDDSDVYEMLGRGETAGIFQVEGSGMTRWLVQMKPKTLANVIAMVALFRPGPMDFIPSYIKRMHGEEEITYRHPALESILQETYGITVYQEQIMFTAMKLAGYSASEADNLRKGVAKKKADVLLLHRQKFVSGAVANQIPEDVANQIFDDWEAFARYGFPKGHAADYGVIAVQTAYLKMHYPVEYMTALLSVNQNDNAKVALYAADCRRLGILVLPPEVNSSLWDFTIQDTGDGKASIRFGLGAIKNVGHGPVDAILEARQGGPFSNLNDFARRIDLRHVGKRALESLIKVGALDIYGPRPALLAAIDRMVSVSTSNFRAADAGQLSLFGAHTGITEEIHLPIVNAEVTRREILNWERELIGLYVSDHPLSPVMDVLTLAVSHFSGQLSEVAHNERVRVAGLVTKMRDHRTKTNKQMGFVTIEDIQGSIDLVLFPRTWTKFSKLIEIDKILLIDGHIDAEGAEPKILVDNISTDLTVTTPLAQPGHNSRSAGAPAVMREPAQAYHTPLPIPDAPIYSGEEDEFIAAGNGDVPPPPEAFPPDWEYMVAPVPGPVAQKTAPAQPTRPAAKPPAGVPGKPAGTPLAAGKAAPAAEKPAPVPATPPAAQIASPAPAVAEPPEALPENDDLYPHDFADPSIDSLAVPLSEVNDAPVGTAAVFVLPPAPITQGLLSGPGELPENLPRYIVPIPEGENGEVQIITVVLHSTGDKARDVLRMRRIHGLASTYPGRDRFAFQVFERNRGFLVEFPNFTTGVCHELMERLRFLVGADNVHVEPVNFG